MTMKTKKTLQHIAAVAVVLLTLCLVFATPVSAEGEDSTASQSFVAYVDDTGYGSLESALSSLTSGSTLKLVTGAYDSFDISVNNVVITGMTDDTEITIKSIKHNAFIGIHANGVLVENLKFTIPNNCQRTGDSWDGYDSVIGYWSKNFDEGSSGITGYNVKNCDFVNQHPDIGVAMFNFDNFIVEGCTFENFNTGICVMDDNSALSTVGITDNTFTKVNHPVDLYWGQTSDETTSALVIRGNTFISAKDAEKEIKLIIDDYALEYVKAHGIDEIDLSGNQFNALTVVKIVDVSVAVEAAVDEDLVNQDNVAVEKEYSSVARVNDVYYGTLQAALNAATEGSTIQLLPGTISEGTIKMPAALKNVVIKGAENKASVLKDTTLQSYDGNTLSYEGITVDGIVFDNSRILVTGWRSGETIYSDWTIQNCEFKNIVDDTNYAAVHFNLANTEPVKNFIFSNNIIDGATGGSKSGVYLQATGTIKFENNVVNNVAFRPYLTGITTNDDISDTLIVTGNTFSGSAAGRLQALGNVADGTDAVDLKINNNIFKDITNAQQICYWNFNAEKTTIDFSENYYDIDLFANPSKIYYNFACDSVDDLIAATVFPYYNKLTEDGKIDTTSIVEPTYTIKATDVGFDSVKVGYAQPDAKDVKVTNNGNVAVTLVKPTNYDNYEIVGDFPTTVINPGESVTFKIQPKAGLAVGNYGTTLEVTNTDNEKATFKVSFLVYQPSSGGSSKPVEEPEEPVVEPEVPTEEPEAGKATVETEVTDGGEVELETPTAGGSAAADEDETKIAGVVLPTGTDSEVTFVPVSEQPAPAGQEENTKKVFEINVPSYEKGKAAVIKFTMTVAELAADGKEAADVALWHFDEETGEWTKLVTSYTIVDGVVYFEAITEDFSPFAIIYEDEPVDEPVDEPETPASPAPVLGLIAALGAAVALRRK